MTGAELLGTLADKGRAFASRARFLMDGPAADRPIEMAQIRGDVHMSEPLSSENRQSFARLVSSGRDPMDVLINDLRLSRDEAARITRDPTTAVGAFLRERGIGMHDETVEDARFKEGSIGRRRGIFRRTFERALKL